MSGQIVTTSQINLALTMTSREIAELVDSRHDKVKQSIERLAERGVVIQPPMGAEQFTDTMGRPRTEQVYCLDKRSSLIVVAQLCPEFTARIVDRWQELEAQAAAPALPNYADALRQLADQIELGEQHKQALALAAPKAAFFDQYADSTGLKGFRQVAKLLQVKENEFREFLADRKIMYRLGGEWVAYAPHLEAGRFKVKTGTSPTTGHAFNEAKFTPKGIEWVAGLLASERVSSALKVAQ